MNKKLTALLIAFTISSAPSYANVSHYFSGLFTGTGLFLCLAGFKQMSKAKTAYEIQDTQTNDGKAETKVIKKSLFSQYKKATSNMIVGVAALVCAKAFYNIS